MKNIIETLKIRSKTITQLWNVSLKIIMNFNVSQKRNVSNSDLLQLNLI